MSQHHGNRNPAPPSSAGARRGVRLRPRGVPRAGADLTRQQGHAPISRRTSSGAQPPAEDAQPPAEDAQPPAEDAQPPAEDTQPRAADPLPAA